VRPIIRTAMLARPLPKGFGRANADQGPDPDAFLEPPRLASRLRRLVLVFGYAGFGVAIVLSLLTGQLHVGKGGPHKAPCAGGYVRNGNDCNPPPGFNSAALASYNDDEVCVHGAGPVNAPRIWCYETASYWRMSPWIHIGDVVHIYFDIDGRVTGLARPSPFRKVFI